VFTAAEPLLFRCRDDSPVDHESGGRIVEDCIDTEDAHRAGITPGSALYTLYNKRFYRSRLK
jgi:hypothetical protein